MKGPEAFSGGAGIKGHQPEFNWVVKDVTSFNVNPSELMHVHMGLVLAGHCYIKEHLMLLLLGGSQGLGPESMISPACKVIKQWHDNVTIQNLHILTDVAKKLQLPLPFVEPLEQREHSIKRVFQQIGRIEPVIKDYEALLDIKLGALNVTHYLLQCINMATCQVLKDAFKECFTNVCKNIDAVKDALHNTECVPLPIVKTFAVVDSGVTSHTGSVKDKGEWGYGQQSQTGSSTGTSSGIGQRGLGERHEGPQERTGGYEQERFGQQQRPFETQRDVGRGHTRQIPVM